MERATTQRRYTHSAAPAHSFVLDAAITVAGLSETVVLLATVSPRHLPPLAAGACRFKTES